MSDKRPFHKQLKAHLNERFINLDELVQTLIAHRSNRLDDIFSNLRPDEIKADLEEILKGKLAPTESFGDLIADLVLGYQDELPKDVRQQREDLIGAAYVAEQHGKRQQFPYLLGVVGNSISPQFAATVIDPSSRQERAREAKQESTLTRLRELEQNQRLARQKLDESKSARAIGSTNGKPQIRNPVKEPCGSCEVAESEKWQCVADVSRAFIPGPARRDDPKQEPSFLHVLQSSFLSGERFGEFLQTLLIAWRPRKGNSRRYRSQTRMSPEHLGRFIGEMNQTRHADDERKQLWFRSNKGVSISGTALRNYISGKYERPLRECIQKMIWALCESGDSQLRVEQKLWRLGNRLFQILPHSRHVLVDLVKDASPSRKRLQTVLKTHTDANGAATHSRVITANVVSGNTAHTFHALSDESGSLFTPLVCPITERVVADVVKIEQTSGELLTLLDVALRTGHRSRVMRALVELSGVPLARIAELTGINKSMFQQWMQPDVDQRIDDPKRAEEIVELLNPPALARWPLTFENVCEQNEAAVAALTKTSNSLGTILSEVRRTKLPETVGQDEGRVKAYRAAQLLRAVFGRGTLTNMAVSDVEQLLVTNGMGQKETFRHLRNGIRSDGRRGQTATLEQARFLAEILHRETGGITGTQRKEFIESVACIDLEQHVTKQSPMEMLQLAKDADSKFGVRDMVKVMVQRTGGIAGFRRKTTVSLAAIRQFISDPGHVLQHHVARRIAEYGMGFSRDNDEYREFVVLSTEAWQKDKTVRVNLSEIYLDYTQRVRFANDHEQVCRIRAEAMGALLAQAALSPSELAEELGVTQAILENWASPKVGHFTRSEALDKFVALLRYEAEQVNVVEDLFGPDKTARKITHS